MPFFIPALIAGASALSGLLANRKKQQTQTSEANFDRTESFDSSEVPLLDEETYGLRNSLISSVLNRLRSSPEFVSSVLANNIKNVNAETALNRQLLNNVMSSRGLSFSPAAANAIARNESSRLGKITNVLNQGPLLEEQALQDRILQALNVFGAIPKGRKVSGTSTSKGKQTSTGTVTQPGNMLGGMFGNLTTALAGLYGAGAFSKNPMQVSNIYTSPQSGTSYNLNNMGLNNTELNNIINSIILGGGGR